jgi:hypothetical protein
VPAVSVPSVSATRSLVPPVHAAPAVDRDGVAGRQRFVDGFQPGSRSFCAWHLSRWGRPASQSRGRVLGRQSLVIDTFRNDRYNNVVQQSRTWLSDSKADHNWTTARNHCCHTLSIFAMCSGSPAAPGNPVATRCTSATAGNGIRANGRPPRRRTRSVLEVQYSVTTGTWKDIDGNLSALVN